METIVWMKILEFRLHENAVASANFYKGIMALYVTYVDPPRTGGKKIRVKLGEFVDGSVISFKECEDEMKEVKDSYPERWKEFCDLLPDALLTATVMEV